MQLRDEDHELCKLTHLNRSFICTNMECIQAKKFQLVCHKCLTLQHTNQKGIQKFKNTKTVRHLDDFIELKDLLNQLESKYQARFNFLQILQQKCFDFQKEQIQKIEKFPFHDQNFLLQAKAEVDTQLQMLINELGYHQRILNEAKLYNNSTQKSILDLYKRNDDKFHNELINKQTQVFDRIRTNLAKKGIDLQKMFAKYIICFTFSQEEKLIQTDDRLKKLENPYATNKLFKFTFIIAILILISNQFSILTQKDQKYIQIKESLLFESDIIQIKEQVSDFQQENIIKIEEIKNTLESKLINEIEYLKLYNQQLKVEMIELQKQFKEAAYFQNQTINTLSQELSNLKEQVQVQNQSFDLNRVQIIKQPNDWDNNNKVFIEKFDKVDEDILQIHSKFYSTIQEVREYVDDRILRNKQFFNAQKYLLGKIEIDYPIVLLQGFKIYLDQYLNKSLSLEQIDELANSFSLTGIACFGGISVKKPSHFAVMACDYAYEIFTITTSRDRARQSRSNDNLFWYFVPRISIGFAPNEKVQLQLADNFDPQDQSRFSIWVDHPQGGRRIGNLTSLIDTTEYKIALYVME